MILALDIGGTKLAAALVNGARVIERLEMPTPTGDRGPESVTRAALELLAPLLNTVQAQGSRLGVAATGVVAEGRVTALNSDMLQGWHAYDLCGTLQAATKLETVILNDADAAAYGEFAHGSGIGTTDFVFVTVSTSVGGGLVLGGRLHLTPHGLHAELGYTLTPDAKPIENVAGGAPMDRWAQARGWSGTREIVTRALQGDVVAIAKLDESAGLVAFKLADLRVTLGITRAAIGGGLGLSTGYIERIKAQLERFGEPWNTLEVVPAELGTNAGLVGAAAWAQQYKHR
jgi:N-acylmannosamine kinase